MNKYKNLINLMPILFAIILLLQSGCNNNSTTPTTTVQMINYLVADTSLVAGARIDGSLLNPWGIDISPTGVFWIACNRSGVTTVYDVNGAMKLAPVDIPSATMPTGGSPTGCVYNGTNDFMDAVTNSKAKWIYSTEDGIISGWASGTAADRLADQSVSGAVYKGLALDSTGGHNYLYATDFKNGKIDVYDKNFGLQNNFAFTDPSIPAGYGPFGIKNINGQLYVTYAMKLTPQNMYDQPGAGNGYVDIFNADGTLVKRFVSQGNLNSPWGIAMAPATFSQFAGTILIGNFGDGTINAYDTSGNLLGQLKDANGAIIKINGLWGLFFIQNAAVGDVTRLYFTAGPYGQNHGLFGYIK